MVREDKYIDFAYLCLLVRLVSSWFLWWLEEVQVPRRAGQMLLHYPLYLCDLQEVHLHGHLAWCGHIWNQNKPYTEEIITTLPHLIVFYGFLTYSNFKIGILENLTCTDRHKHIHLFDKIYIWLKVCWLPNHVKTYTCSPLDKHHEGNIC